MSHTEYKGIMYFGMQRKWIISHANRYVDGVGTIIVDKKLIKILNKQISLERL